MEKKTYFGRGRVHLAPVAGDGALRRLGNCSELSIQIEEQVVTMPDYINPGGGTYDEIRRIQSVNIGMSLWELSKENLALALFGDASVAASAAVSGEAHTIYKGGLVKFTKIPDPDETVTVEVIGSPGGPLVENTHYERTPGGIFILADAASPAADAAEIEVDYTSLGTDVVQGLVNSGKEFRLVFEGLNEADSEKAVIVEIFRAKFGPASVPLIADEFSQLQFTGASLVDSSKVGAGISKYLTVQSAQ